jgi:hypothetical protein
MSHSVVHVWEGDTLADKRERARAQARKMDQRMRLRRAGKPVHMRRKVPRVSGDLAFAAVLALVAVIALT